MCTGVDCDRLIFSRHFCEGQNVLLARHVVVQGDFSPSETYYSIPLKGMQYSKVMSRIMKKY